MESMTSILGFTIENMFSKYLGSEEIMFVHYHINRSCLSMLIHSILPVGYFFIHFFFFEIDWEDEGSFMEQMWWTLNIASMILPLVVMTLIWSYKRKNWSTHPIPKILANYCNTPEQGWEAVAAGINTEFRRSDKLLKQFSSVCKIIATENWIMKTSLYFVHFAHQSDSALIADRSDAHSISMHDTTDSAQFVNIQVKPTRRGVKNFSLRINSLDFKDLQDRINRPIVVLSSVKFHTSLIDRFIEVFETEVKANAKYPITGGLASEFCFACMVKTPDVKINKSCNDGVHEENCTNCFCRPMWCVGCLGRWFASRQNSSERDVWLRKQATCPMCRAKFCILDVCLVNDESQS